MADVLISGVLGAAVFAIFLLYRSHVKHTKLINELRAELTAQKIAALTQTRLDPTVDVNGERQEEHCGRRKGHLTLLCGEGMASALSSIGDRCQSAWNEHRRLTATAATTVAVAGTAVVVLVVASGDSSGAPPSAHGPSVTATGSSPGGSREPGKGEGSAATEIQASNAAHRTPHLHEAGTTPLLAETRRADDRTRRGADGTSASTPAPSPTPEGHTTPAPTFPHSTPAPDLPGTTTPSPSRPTITAAPTPKPSPSHPSTDAELCVLGLSQLGLCLAAG